MKSTHCCPKCNCNEIAKVKGGAFKGNLYNTISTGLNTIYLTRYICLSCGFTENYVEDTDDLEKLAKRHRVDFENQEFV
ncbi:MAG: hypothetical protein H6567_01815 [Lewinellaceae bacterium]|nr:hypothetical protein [Lewinellaceae bacterium]